VKNRKGTRFYRERAKPGDYIAVFTQNGRGWDGTWPARATAISGLVGSVQTTGVSVLYLRDRCRRVERSAVPPEWLAILDPPEDS
jgi:hypothetical protein